MRFVIVGKLTGLVLAAAIGLSPLAPPEHVHESHNPDHHATLVHRHAGGHGAHRHAAPLGGRFDDDDASVITLQAVFDAPTAPIQVAPPIVESAIRVEPPLPERSPTAEYVELLIHGPPGAPASLRAPPSLLAV
jgi:hypothetical protein